MKDSTWITEEFIQAYTNLHHHDLAFSIECYLEDEVSWWTLWSYDWRCILWRKYVCKSDWCFKSCIYHLCQQAQKNGIKLIDCQVYNDHLASLGASEISREEYFEILGVK